MSDILRVACVQTDSTPDVERNLGLAESLIWTAAAGGAQLIALPEAVEFIDTGPQKFDAHAKAVGAGPLDRLRAVAADLRVWLLVGSLSVKVGDRLANRSYLVDDQGSVVRFYDKIHLFDVELPNGEQHRESAVYVAGETAVLSPTPWGAAGLSICYDLRFPALYRRLAQGGARLLFIPAAFTRTTGPLHWHTLVRARAIETGCFVVAPAQCGIHVGDRGSYGHSLIVDPWGRVLADGGDEVGIVTADLDLGEVDRFRAAIPSPLLEREFRLTADGQ